MNPRIKEIFEDAHKKPLGDSWTYETNANKVASKFAELIIKESARLCCKDINDDACTKDAGKYFSKKIKRHFGFIK